MRAVIFQATRSLLGNHGAACGPRDAADRELATVGRRLHE